MNGWIQGKTIVVSKFSSHRLAYYQTCEKENCSTNVQRVKSRNNFERAKGFNTAGVKINHKSFIKDKINRSLIVREKKDANKPRDSIYSLIPFINKTSSRVNA